MLNCTDKSYTKNYIEILYNILHNYKNIENEFDKYDYLYANYQVKLRIYVLYSLILINNSDYYEIINLKKIEKNLTKKEDIIDFGNKFNYSYNINLINYFEELFSHL